MKFGGWDFFLEEGKTPVGVVLVHEIFGFNDYIKSVASEFSKSGYWAVAVDIFRGRKPGTLEEGRGIRESLSKAEVLDALGTGLKLLKQKAGHDVRVGTMGFCMGGGFALLGACNLEFDFCIDYYGSIQNVEEVAGLKCPVQLMLGSEDDRINAWSFQSFLPTAMKFKKRSTSTSTRTQGMLSTGRAGKDIMRRPRRMRGLSRCYFSPNSNRRELGWSSAHINQLY